MGAVLALWVWQAIINIYQLNKNNNSPFEKYRMLWLGIGVNSPIYVLFNNAYV